MRIKRKPLAATIVGAFLVFLGALRLMQGTSILSVCPILCFSDCQCVKGGSQFWEVIGAVTLAIGGVAVGISVRRIRE